MQNKSKFLILILMILIFVPFAFAEDLTNAEKITGEQGGTLVASWETKELTFWHRLSGRLFVQQMAFPPYADTGEIVHSTIEFWGSDSDALISYPPARVKITVTGAESDTFWINLPSNTISDLKTKSKYVLLSFDYHVPDKEGKYNIEARVTTSAGIAIPISTFVDKDSFIVVKTIIGCDDSYCTGWEHYKDISGGEMEVMKCYEYTGDNCDESIIRTYRTTCFEGTPTGSGVNAYCKEEPEPEEEEEPEPEPEPEEEEEEEEPEPEEELECVTDIDCEDDEFCSETNTCEKKIQTQPVWKIADNKCIYSPEDGVYYTESACEEQLESKIKEFLQSWGIPIAIALVVGIAITIFAVKSLKKPKKKRGKK